MAINTYGMTVEDIRNASSVEKNQAVADRYAQKPITNTSGTAAPQSSGTNQLMDAFYMGFKQNKSQGPERAFFGGVNMMRDPALYREAKFKEDVRAGKYYTRPSSVAPAPTPSTGINAPEPDTGWTPFGSGLNAGQTPMVGGVGSIPVQERVGVARRRRR